MSVIVPTRNRPNQLARALDSVLAQEGLGSQFDVHIVVVDDASSSDTRHVVRRYPRAAYVRLEHQRGAAAARNIGLSRSRGDYVAFLDDDDLWLPHKLRIQIPALEKDPESALVYGQALVIREGSPYELVPLPDVAPRGFVFRDLLLLGCPFVHPAVLLVRREVFRSVGYFDEQLRSIEDFDLWLRIAFQFRFQFIARPVSVYYSMPQGLYFSEVLHGSALEDSRTVMHRAMDMMPKTRENDRFRHEILLRAECYFITRKAQFAPPHEKARVAAAALDAMPEILGYRWGREVAMAIAPLFTASDSPIAAVRAWCRKTRTAARGRVSWFAMHLAAASVWASTALDLACGPIVNLRAAQTAALLAVLHNPWKARQLRRLVLGIGPRTAEPNKTHGPHRSRADIES